jgi:hypothetical protein
MTDRAANRQTNSSERRLASDKDAAARQRARDRAADDDLPRKSGAVAKPGGSAPS